MIDQLLASDVFLNAGLFGALMVFMIVITTTFLGFLYYQMGQWRATIKDLWDRQAASRKEAMEHGLSDVEELARFVRSNSQDIRALAQAMGSHSTQAIARHGQLMTKLGRIEGQVASRDHDALMAIIREVKSESVQQ